MGKREYSTKEEKGNLTSKTEKKRSPRKTAGGIKEVATDEKNSRKCQIGRRKLRKRGDSGSAGTSSMGWTRKEREKDAKNYLVAEKFLIGTTLNRWGQSAIRTTWIKGGTLRTGENREKVK